MASPLPSPIPISAPNSSPVSAPAPSILSSDYSNSSLEMTNVLHPSMYRSSSISDLSIIQPPDDEAAHRLSIEEDEKGVRLIVDEPQPHHSYSIFQGPYKVAPYQSTGKSSLPPPPSSPSSRTTDVASVDSREELKESMDRWWTILNNIDEGEFRFHTEPSPPSPQSPPTAQKGLSPTELAHQHVMWSPYVITFVREWCRYTWSRGVDAKVFWQPGWLGKARYRRHAKRIKAKLTEKVDRLCEAFTVAQPSSTGMEVEHINRLLAELQCDIELWWRAVLTNYESTDFHTHRGRGEARFDISEGGNVIRYEIEEINQRPIGRVTRQGWTIRRCIPCGPRQVDPWDFQFSFSTRVLGAFRLALSQFLLLTLFLFVSFLDQWRDTATGEWDVRKIVNNAIVFTVLFLIAALVVKESAEVSKSEQSYNSALQQFIRLQGWIVNVYVKAFSMGQEVKKDGTRDEMKAYYAIRHMEEDNDPSTSTAPLSAKDGADGNKNPMTPSLHQKGEPTSRHRSSHSTGLSSKGDASQMEEGEAGATTIDTTAASGSKSLQFTG